MQTCIMLNPDWHHHAAVIVFRITSANLFLAFGGSIVAEVNAAGWASKVPIVTLVTFWFLCECFVSCNGTLIYIYSFDSWFAVPPCQHETLYFLGNLMSNILGKTGLSLCNETKRSALSEMFCDPLITVAEECLCSLQYSLVIVWLRLDKSMRHFDLVRMCAKLADFAATLRLMRFDVHGSWHV